METRQALARSEAHCRALEARVIVLETEVHRHEWQGFKLQYDWCSAYHAYQAWRPYSEGNYAMLPIGAALEASDDDKYCREVRSRRLFPEEIDKIEKNIGGFADMIHGSVKYSPSPNDKKQWSLVWFDFYKIPLCTSMTSRRLFKLQQINPVHAYYNGSCTSKDNEDPSWSTSFKTRRTSKTSSALEALWKTLFMLYLYKIGTLKHPLYTEGLIQKLVLKVNHKFRGGLLGIKGFYKFLLLVQLSTAKRRLSTVNLS
ncbi:hypothetical protein Tco_0179195 [Tanacetum coccineum]